MTGPSKSELPTSLVIHADEDMDALRLRIEAASEGPLGVLEALLYRARDRV